jgi:hypothetical protein
MEVFLLDKEDRKASLKTSKRIRNRLFKEKNTANSYHDRKREF